MHIVEANSHRQTPEYQPDPHREGPESGGASLNMTRFAATGSPAVDVTLGALTYSLVTAGIFGWLWP